MSDHNDDPRVRELTYRLMEMAPDAPPFPKEATVKISDIRQRSPMLVLASAAAAVVLLVGLPLFLFRGDDGGTDPATTIAADTTTVPTTVDEPTTTVQSTTLPAEGDYIFFHNVYVFSDSQTTFSGDPALVPVHKSWDLAANDPDPEVLVQNAPNTTTLSVAAAIWNLIDLSGSGLAGYSTSIPGDIELLDVMVDDGVATVSLSSEFESGGGTMAMTTRLAQVVFTATQFPDVDSVLFMIDDEVVDVFSGEGIILDRPQTREDYVDILPLVFLDTPAIGSAVQSPVTLSGMASVYEATLLYEIWNSEDVRIASGSATATCGDSCWGEFSVDVPFAVDEDTAGQIVVYAESPLDLSPEHELRFDVTLLSGGVPPTTTTTESATTTTLPGEVFDIGPRAGDVVAVIGVAHDDVLNVRAAPGAEFEVIARLDPLAADLVATGRHRLLTRSIWNEITADGVTGWVNSSYIGYLGGVDDLTSQIVSQMGGIPEAETMLDLGAMVAESFAVDEGGFRAEMVIPPTVGDLGEVTFDVVGLLDDSQLGWRLHIFGQPTEGGEGFNLMSVEATAICGRGVTEGGLCV